MAYFVDFVLAFPDFGVPAEYLIDLAEHLVGRLEVSAVGSAPVVVSAVAADYCTALAGVPAVAAEVVVDKAVGFHDLPLLQPLIILQRSATHRHSDQMANSLP